MELPHRYRPENLELLCENTGFTEEEMKRIYRGFKTECPTGLITEEVFHGIYSRFFPQGGRKCLKLGQFMALFGPFFDSLGPKRRNSFMIFFLARWFY